MAFLGDLAAGSLDRWLHGTHTCRDPGLCPDARRRARQRYDRRIGHRDTDDPPRFAAGAARLVLRPGQAWSIRAEAPVLKLLAFLFLRRSLLSGGKQCLDYLESLGGYWFSFGWFSDQIF